MKTYLTALLSFLITPVLAFAALDVTMSSSAVINVNGVNLVVSGTANFDSISVDVSNFSIQLSAGSTLTVTSSDRKEFIVSPDTYTLTRTCDSTQSSVTVATLAGGPSTVTITPSSTVCSTSVGGSGGGSTGGGTSIRTPTSSSSASSSAASSAVSSVSSAPTVVAASPASTAASPSSAARAASPVFNKNLSRGSRGEDVSNLQRLLAQDKTVYPEGLVTGVFGPMTEKAVKKFQAKYSLPQVGIVGPATREILQIVASISLSVTAQTPSQSSPALTQSARSAPSAVSAGTINKRLSKGMKDAQISTLQQWLSKDKEIYPDAIVSGYFGSLTEKAVQKFQEKYGIAAPGEEGYGAVGPKTRAKLSEIFGGNN